MASARKTPESKYTADRQIPGAFEGETVTRRRFMTATVHIGGAAAALGFTLPVLGFAAGTPLFERPKAPWTPVGRPEDFPTDTYIPKAISILHGVGEIGKTTAYVRAYNADFDGPKSKLPGDMPGAGDFIAVSTRCAHLGCPVRYVDAAKRFICPCHGGVYDFRGSRSGGPPVRPLDRFYVRVRNNQVEVGPRYSVNSEFKRYPNYRDPGQDLDGLGPYLYPGRLSTPKK